MSQRKFCRETLQLENINSDGIESEIELESKQELESDVSTCSEVKKADSTSIMFYHDDSSVEQEKLLTEEKKKSKNCKKHTPHFIEWQSPIVEWLNPIREWQVSTIHNNQHSTNKISNSLNNFLQSPKLITNNQF